MIAQSNHYSGICVATVCSTRNLASDHTPQKKLQIQFLRGGAGVGQLARLCLEHSVHGNRNSTDISFSQWYHLDNRYISLPGDHHFTHWYQVHLILMCEITIPQEKIQLLLISLPLTVFSHLSHLHLIINGY